MKNSSCDLICDEDYRYFKKDIKWKNFIKRWFYYKNFFIFKRKKIEGEVFFIKRKKVENFKFKRFTRLLKKEFKKVKLTFILDKDENELYFVKTINKFCCIRLVQNSKNGILIMISEENFSGEQYLESSFDFNIWSDIDFILNLIKQVMKNKFNYIKQKAEVRNYKLKGEDKKINYFYFRLNE